MPYLCALKGNKDGRQNCYRPSYGQSLTTHTTAFLPKKLINDAIAEFAYYYKPKTSYSYAD